MARPQATEQKQATILAAALKCFDEVGIVAATMEDIRTEAGVSVGSLYHHFPNKEAVAAALYVRLIASYQDSAIKAVARRRTPRAQIRATIAHHITWSIENENATRFLLAHREPEVRRLSDPDVAGLNREIETRVEAWLQEEAAAGRIRTIPADIYLSLVIGPAQAFVRRWIAGSTSISPDKAIVELSEAAWRAVRAE